ncbi:cytochrome c oxidase subunit 2 [Modicisalibacter ilicicola DSM 19980]|uniref:Cytochrome c oxidase subunit 2 n=1 Tax=Modicisalibacter ilicicola DSM 19980 TaxID=1121942 RepID=A0A1M4X779_9GAMM|nr:cytochrome c oxidase subunit II [Halomonas ilicicola]SHE89344.1 cytochrome c oxidase subunit 2 [Halomonas ilicicola DSM 19980]
MRKMLVLAALMASVTGLSRAARAAGWNMPVGVTEVSRDVYGLHMVIFWICVIIGVIVFGIMFYSLFRYRRSKGAQAAHFHEHTTVEVFWTAIPLLILVAMAIPATATLKDMYDASEAELDVMVTGHQWRWHYHYMGEDITFFSNLDTPREQIDGTAEKGENYLLEVDQPLVLPVGRKVRLLMTSSDVIHSWWVPDLAVKKDAVPGFVNEAWTRIDEPGIYRGQCAELCGKDHAFMPVVVQAMEQEAFDTWLAERKQEAAAAASGVDREWKLEELVERGEKVYGSICASCHQADGQGTPPTFPALAGNQAMMDDLDWHIDVVVNGVSGSAMAAFSGTLNPVDLAAVITYERNAWGNETGDVVQPAEIQALIDP